MNFERRSPDDLIQEGDYFTSLNHYHEDPVLDEPIDVIFENEDVLVNLWFYEYRGPSLFPVLLFADQKIGENRE